MDFQYGHLHHHHHQEQQQQNQQMMSSGLTRYRSAPSSYFASYLDDFSTTADADTFTLNSHGSGMDDLDHFLSRFGQGQSQLQSQTTTRQSQLQSQTTTHFVKQEQEQENSGPVLDQSMQSDYSHQTGFQMMRYQNQQPATAPAPAPAVELVNNSSVPINNVASSSTSMEGYSNNRVVLSSNQFAPMKMATGGGGGGYNSSNLVRYNSSPAGLFANINTHTEYGALSSTANITSHRGRATVGGGDNKTFSSSCVLPNSDRDNKNNNISWEDDDDESTLLSDTFLKVLEEEDLIINQNKVTSTSSSSSSMLLSRHLSLPITTTTRTTTTKKVFDNNKNLSAMETLIMQDSVLCKIRAKRGCATHPRSIAERVRRTRISERMRKLQELVPNMEKQTNTSDMLDLAVDYIKDLQEQVKTLADNRANCRCSTDE